MNSNQQIGFPIATTASPKLTGKVNIDDDGSFAGGRCTIASGTNTISFNAGFAGAAWTNSGTKEIHETFTILL